MGKYYQENNGMSKIVKFFVVWIIRLSVTIVAFWLGHEIGFKNGWSASFIDNYAVTSYHEQADNLLNDDNPDSLAAIWQSCIIQAQDYETFWESVGFWQKLKYPIEPFWKRGAGEPRRLSKSQRNKLVDALKAVGKVK